ncbi:uncharacterized protein V6R79_009511 [Siganus canaliculatus]
MKRPSVFQLAFLSLCSVLITVRESNGSFVPGRCQCPETTPGVRGQLKNLTVHPKSPSCDKITVIVTLKADNSQACLDPDAPMGAQLIRCWNRIQKRGGDVQLCLKRRKKRKGGNTRNVKRQRSRQRSRSLNRNASTH